MTATINTVFPEIVIRPWVTNVLEFLGSSLRLKLPNSLHVEGEEEEEEEAPENESLDDRSMRRHTATMDKLFKKGSEEEPEEEPEEGEEEPEEESEEEPEEEEEGEGIDYEEEPEEEEEEPEEDEEPANETMARKQARLNGRRAKELKAEVAEKDLEIARIQGELEQSQARLEEFDTVAIDPTSHPDFAEKQQAILREMGRTADRLSADPAVLRGNFGGYVVDYLKSTNEEGPERDEKVAALKSRILDDLAGPEEGYADLLDDDRLSANGDLDKILDLLERNANRAEELINLESEITTKAKAGRLALGVREYDKTLSDFDSTLEAVGALDEETIEADPYAIEAVVSKIVTENPKMATKLKTAKRDAVEAMFGPRPLSQNEIDKLEENGTDMKEFLGERQKRFVAKRKKMLAYLIQHLMTRGLNKKHFRELSDLKRRENSEENELDTLERVTSRRRAPKPSPKKADNIPASKRPNAVEGLFRGD